ncbi:MAG: PQQ-binding-like beta-propeller repeat protein, partial [Zavarzinella sp.]|nr:PQQ-binding-like beta-propeller repeat protein [Zavarzinella sp.]
MSLPVRSCRPLLVAVLVAATARAQERPPDNATAARIADGVEKARAGKLLDAVEQFQRVLDTAGDELVPVDGRHHAPARWVVFGHLSRLPPEGLKLYRQRVDPQAAKRLEEAKKSRDDAALSRLLADMFPSRPVEDAILELARRAFERADFDAAEHFWRMLLPTEPDDDRFVRFPEPRTDPAAVKARLILIKLFRSERAEAKDDLKEFKEKYPAASGLLAGKTGKYAETLTELLNDPAQTTIAPRPDEPGWPTFAGSPAREGNMRTRLPYFWPDVPTWQKRLPFTDPDRKEKAHLDPLHPRALAFYPVVSGGRAYVADGTRVLAIDLVTGQISKAQWHDKGEETRIPTKQDVRYTLTEADGVLYARFGPAGLKPTEGGAGGSFIVALGPRTDGTEDRNVLWRLDPPAVADATTHFEGAPVVHRGRLYVGLWRQAGAEATAGVACYRIDDPKAAPELAWQTMVGKAGSEPNGETRYRHELVTISGTNVVYCTDGGTVAALDLRTGRPAWEYRYPRNERPTVPRYRDLCPPLADGGRIYAAPADTDRLLCLDAYTGQLIWDREGVEVIHLLGVAKGRLIATIGGQVRGIRGFNAWTGIDSGTGGWTIHDDGGEATFGRGLVTDEVVVWPTRHGLRFLDPADGRQLRSPIPGPPLRALDGGEVRTHPSGPFGNLCYADGVLLVTTATEVWGYVSEAKKLGARQKAVEADPDNPVLNAELAQSLIDAGRSAEAEAAAAKAGDAKDRLRWLLAEKVIRAGDREGATRLYEDLAKGDGSFAAAGAARLAEMTADPMKAREAWRVVFAKRGTVRDEWGIPWPARTYAEMHFREPLVMRGTGVRDDDLVGLVGAEPKPEPPPPLPGYVRSLARPLDDPSLRILQASEHGIVAAGERFYVFPDGRNFELRGHPEAAAFDGSWVTSAGPERVSCRSAGDGRVEWDVECRPNGPILSPIRHVALPAGSGIDGPRELAAMQLSPETASFLYESRWLVKLVPIEGFGEVRAAAGARPAALQAAHSRWCDIAQTVDGRMLVWGHGAQAVREFPCTRKPWPEPPLPVERDRFLIPDDGSVFLFDAKAGKELARYTIPGEDTLTGELPRFRVHQGDVLLLIDRNHGVELDRLKLDGLKRAWERSPVLVGRELDDIAFSGDRFFIAAEGTLVAYDWKDGQAFWDVPLPEAPHAHWRLSVSPQGLLVHPTEAVLLKAEFDAIGEFRRAGWSRDGLLRAVDKSYDAWAARELPVLVIDPADGRLVQRFTFPAAGPAAGVAVTPKGVVVVTGKGSWTLAASK